MKTLTLALILLASLSSHAQLLKRQSIMAIPGIFNLLFENTVHYPDYEMDFESPEMKEVRGFAARNQELRFANLESTFSFFNDKESFKGLFVKDLGICRGYSSLRRKFRLLAFFDAKNEAGIEVPNREKHPRKYVRFYKKLIKQIRKGQPTIIPGYANLREFSSDELVSDMIKMQVFREWRKKNFSSNSGTTSDMLRGTLRHSTYEELLYLRDHVEAYAKEGLNTMIWTAVKKSGWIHVLEAVEASPVDENGDFKLKLWNDKSMEEAKMYSYLTVTKKGDILYDDFIDPTRVMHSAGVTKENDGEIRYLGENLKKFLTIKE